jgi:hypothetical protein
LVLVSCRGDGPSGGASTAGSVGAQTSAVRLVISQGTRLGVLDLPVGKPGVLTLERQGPDAEKLKRLVDEINASDVVSVAMHLPPDKPGERGAYGARVYRRGNADYPEGVKLKLLDALFSVDRGSPAP